jgi:hypothetical protein
VIVTLKKLRSQVQKCSAPRGCSCNASEAHCSSAEAPTLCTGCQPVHGPSYRSSCSGEALISEVFSVECEAYKVKDEAHFEERHTSCDPQPLQAALAASSLRESWIARFLTSYHAAEDFTAFALVVRAAEDRSADVFPHTLFGAARFLLLRLLQVPHPQLPTFAKIVNLHYFRLCGLMLKLR